MSVSTMCLLGTLEEQGRTKWMMSANMLLHAASHMSIKVTEMKTDVISSEVLQAITVKCRIFNSTGTCKSFHTPTLSTVSRS